MKIYFFVFYNFLIYVNFSDGNVYNNTDKKATLSFDNVKEICDIKNNTNQLSSDLNYIKHLVDEMFKEKSGNEGQNCLKPENKNDWYNLEYTFIQCKLNVTEKVTYF